MAKSRTPTHLSKAAKAWFTSVIKAYELDETHLEILRMAAELLDRAENARQLVQQDGAILVDRFGQQREHPAAKLERDSKIAFARMMRELGLAHDDGDDSRPPRPGVTSCREK
jgi:phage terminase small subunit